MEEQSSDERANALARIEAPITAATPNAVITAELPVRRSPATAFERAHPFERPKIPPEQGPPRSLRLAVGVLFVLSVLSLGALIAGEVQPAWFVALRGTSGPPAPSIRTRAPGNTALAPSDGTSATISSIEPSVGAAGDSVAIIGHDIMSPNGTIIAKFGSEVASTRCPSADHCLVTVPPAGGSRSVTVRLQVGSGLSNALVFRYR